MLRLEQVVRFKQALPRLDGAPIVHALAGVLVPVTDGSHDAHEVLALVGISIGRGNGVAGRAHGLLLDSGGWSGRAVVLTFKLIHAGVREVPRHVFSPW